MNPSRISPLTVLADRVDDSLPVKLYPLSAHPTAVEPPGLDQGNVCLFDQYQADPPSGEPLKGKFLPRFHVRKPDTLVIVDCQSLHGGNLPFCPLGFKDRVKEGEGWHKTNIEMKAEGGLTKRRQRITRFTI